MSLIETGCWLLIGAASVLVIVRTTMCALLGKDDDW